MIVLGIEAATAGVGVALIKEGILLAERFLSSQRSHSANLLTMIKGTLEEAGVNPCQLSGIAVSIGPGSFTGLRISLTAAKTLAQVLTLPIVGVSTLEALAYLLVGRQGGLICPVLDARKNEVYAAVYNTSGGSLKCILEPVAIAPEELAVQLKEIKKPVAFIGDGALTWKELFGNYLGAQAVFAPGELSLPRAAAVAGLGWQKLLAKEVSDPFLLTPLYLRLSEAEMKWLQKQRVKQEI